MGQSGLMYKIYADNQQAEAAIKALSNKVHELERKLRRASKAGKDKKQSLDNIAMSAGKAALGFIGITSAMSAMQKGFGVLEKIDSYLLGISDRSKEAAKSFIALAAMTNPETVKYAAGLGLPYGVKPSQAVEVYQTAYSSKKGAEDKVKSTALAKAAMEAMALDVDQESAMAMALTADATSPRQGVAKAYRAAQLSKYTPAQMAKAAPALGFYPNSNEAWAAIAGMSQSEQIVPDKILTYAQQGGIALTEESPLNTKAKKYLKKQGANYDAMSTAEKISGLKDYLYDVEAPRRAKRERISLEKARAEAFSVPQVRIAGYEEKRGAIALSAMMDSEDFIARTPSDIGKAKAEDMEGYKKAGLEKDENIRAWYLTNQVQAQNEYYGLYSEEGKRARDLDASRKVTGLKMRGDGWGPWVDQETGRPGMMGDFLYNAPERMSRPSSMAGVGASVPGLSKNPEPTQAPQDVLQEMLKVQQETLEATKALAPDTMPLRNGGLDE